MKCLQEINPLTELYMLDCKGLHLLLGYYRTDFDTPLESYKNWNKHDNEYDVDHKSKVSARAHYGYIRNVIRAEMTSRKCDGNYKRFKKRD